MGESQVELTVKQVHNVDCDTAGKLRVVPWEDHFSEVDRGPLRKTANSLDDLQCCLLTEETKVQHRRFWEEVQCGYPIA